jgi:hypothetical protein
MALRGNFIGTKAQFNALLESTTNGISFALIIGEQNAHAKAIGFGGYAKGVRVVRGGEGTGGRWTTQNSKSN